jgi:tetratricopeptide (TPR) repeat protein
LRFAAARPEVLAALTRGEAVVEIRTFENASGSVRPVSAIPGLPARFRLDQEVGRGGMSVVYRAYDTQLDRFVAIKVLSESASTAIDAERFLREIAVTARLAHPCIVSLFDSGVAEGRVYYVMPYVPGDTLRAKLQRERRLTMEEACSHCADVADALAFAHAGGIVHRDVKPENIFVVGGRALLADFGIARVSSEATAPDAMTSAGPGGLTTAGIIVGTYSYMSPEQIAGSPSIDGRSDFYSLGCVLYELLTGAPPFSGSAADVLRQHLATSPPAIARTGVRTSRALDDLVSRLLAKDPSGRPSSAADVGNWLRQATQAGSFTQPAVAAPDTDRLLAEGLRALRLGGAGGPSARASLDQAEVYLTRLLALEPRHARALCLYGNWHYVMSRLGYRPGTDGDARGRELIMAALSADDQVAEVHSSLAKIALYYDDDCHTAERHSSRAIALDPGDAEVLRTHSIILKILGRPEAAVEAAEDAVALDPKMPSVLNALGDALRAAGRHHDAIVVLRRAIALQPAFGPSVERIERELAEVGDLEAATDFRLSLIRLTGDRARAAQLADDIDRAGPAEARRLDLRREVDQLLARAESDDPFAHYPAARALADRIALAYSDLGEWASAVTWLERAHALQPGRLRRLVMDMPFNRQGLATDRRYIRLMRVAGLDDLIPA